MKKEKSRVVFDVETYNNYFGVCFKDWKTKKVKWFEISEWRNDREEMLSYLSGVDYLVGFNSVHFDSILLEFIKRKERTAFEIWEMAQYIIYHQDKETSEEIEDRRQLDLFGYEKYNLSIYKGDNFEKYKYFRYHDWIDIDLFLYWSKMTRQSKKLSLKSLACNIGWHWIQELPFEPMYTVKKEDIEELKRYCQNDVDITYKLLELKKDEVNFRQSIQNEEGLKCLSWDGVKIGVEYIFKELSKETGVAVKDLKSHKTIRKTLKPIEFLPKISFKNPDCQRFYDYLKNNEFHPKKSIEYQIRFKNPDGSVLIADLGSGGQHGIGTHKLVNNRTQLIEDEDVTGMYPSICAEWGFIPKHIPVQLSLVIKRMLAERAKYPKKSMPSELRKLGANSSVGMFKNGYSPLLDAQANLAICITGQLCTLRAVELSILNGINVIAINTDGYTVLMDKDKEPTHRQIVKQVSEEFRVNFERTSYEKIWFRDINNYLAVETNGKVKEKGFFLTNPPMDMSHDFLIIPKAIQAYLLKGTSIENFIGNHKEILDFCMCPKIAKKYRVEYLGKKVQNLNRFYPCKKGAYIYKKKLGTDRNMEHVFSQSPVKLLNLHNNEPFDSFDVDLSYFINECKSVLRELGVINEQISLL